ncbi:hypothetical protein [uncultured Chitinophaga sp.]|uniref:hypothetical protein n=1 Tax=uncultured Chitinophaga sp. TaxID=339340 RepID=UPI0025DD2090|nr:hypothetical protein [uncultured Chitinophaga sp.]
MIATITQTELMADEKNIIIKAFDDATDNYWKTITEIAEETSISLEHVFKIIYSSDEFIESSYCAPDGQHRFSTLTAFRKKASFFEKLRGAINNRID